MTAILASAIDSQASPLAFLAWFGCLCGIYIFGQGTFLLRRKRRQARSTISAIRNARPGLLYVNGRTEGISTLIAPVSGKPCFYYRAIVWRQQEPAHEDSWEIVADETMSRPFVLNDATGRILVDPRGAEVDWPHDTYEEYGKTLLATHTDVPPGLEEFLTRHKVDTKAALRVEVSLIAPGAEAFALGMSRANPEVQKQAEKEAKKTAAQSSRTKTDSSAVKKGPAGEPKAIAPQVIRLSAQPVIGPASEMTMQSRVAAALTLARRNPVQESAGEPAREKDSTSPLRVPSISVAVEQRDDNRDASPKEDRKEGDLTQRAQIEDPKRTAAAAPPAFVLGQPEDETPLTLSYRNQPAAESPSGARAVAFLVSGPLLTLASAYFLLLNFGWL